jgi:folate-binding protein YgfZ
MLADVEIYRRAEAWLIGLSADRAASIAERLDQSVFSEDVAVSDVTSSFAEIAVLGARAATSLAAALGVSAGDVERLPELAQHELPFGFVVRTGEADVPMFHVIVDASHRDEVIERLEAAGARPVSAAVVEMLRIEAGRARFGVDMGEDTIPLEAGLLERAISTSKGCYVGQEIIIRILHRGGGRVARRLVTLAGGVADLDVPAAGASLLEGDVVVGRLTSVAPARTGVGFVALGYVPRDLAEEGRQFAVAQTDLTATVTGLAR